MSNKDLCQIKTFFHLGKALDLTVTQRKIIIKTKVHLVQTTSIDYYFMFIPEEFIAKVFHRRKWFFDDFTGCI